MNYLKIILLCTAFLSVTLYSQPLYKINIHGGYSLALPDLKGDLTDSADQYNTLTMSNGFNEGVDFKLYPFKKKNIGFTLSINYNMFSSSADTGRLYMDIGYALINDIKYKLNSFSMGIGAEYSFSPKQKFNPFAGLEINGSYFMGSKEFTNAGNLHNNTMKPALRMGFGAGLGFDLSFSKYFALTAGGKYVLANVINKQDTFTELENVEYPLFDGEIAPFASKNISYIQLYLGISYIIDQKKTGK